MGFDSPGAQRVQRGPIKDRITTHDDLSDGNEPEDRMRFRKADRIGHARVRCQHPLDRLGIHETPTAPKDAIKAATKVEIP